MEPKIEFIDLPYEQVPKDSAEELAEGKAIKKPLPKKYLNTCNACGQNFESSIEVSNLIPSFTLVNCKNCQRILKKYKNITPIELKCIEHYLN